MGTVNFDLFGLPVAEGHGKAGRPRREATDEERNKIKLLLAVGWSNERMAQTVGMSLPTFRRNFLHELKERAAMRDRLDARRLEVTAKLALDQGNIGAIKELGKMLERSDLMGMDRRIQDAQRKGASDDEKQAPRAAPIGKKEAAQEAAKTAGEGSSWGSDLMSGVYN